MTTLTSRAFRPAIDFVVALQFLTRIPMPAVPFEPDSLARAVMYFPLVGLLIGSGAALLQHALLPHLDRTLVALLVLSYLVLITGCLHEDGLADTVDGLAGGWNREQKLAILRDSRIGSYGAAALVLSLLGRFLLLAYLPLSHAAAYLISAHVLCRWSTLPLSRFLPPARAGEGQAARVAQRTSSGSFVLGSVIAGAVAIGCLRKSAFAPIIVASLVAWVSSRVYLRQLGGVTGDCFGATNQLTEIAVYFCGVWHV